MNPYRIGVALLIKRLLWDCRLESWRSRSKLRELKNTKQGERAVILCNGPSLNNVDFEKLENIYTFGLNKINLLFSRTQFRPSAVVAVNPYVIEQNAEFYNETEIPLFLDSVAIKHVQSKESVAFLHSANSRNFARDCSMSVFQGYTVTFVAMQLAFHMGFERVALVGCDHSFSSKGPANKAVVSGDKDPDHFDSNYFAGGQPWQLPDLLQSEISYMLAKEAYEVAGREIVNATDGGKLEVFVRQDLGSFIS
jgi:hypothetical protein